MKKELELAAQVQTLLIPDQLPKDDAIEMAAIYQPHRDIGGDYYDYLEVNEDEIVFCIADISGKGIAAALLMANFQAQLRAYLRQNYLPITDFIQQLNKNVNQITRGDKFITMFLAKYNKATRVLKYINAGHNPPVLLQNGKSQLLDKGCTILGMFEELPFVNMQEITLELSLIHI